jgi:hypothetical protein
MEKLQGSAHILRHVVLWTLIGFGVLVLSGPIIAIVGTLLPFALVGLLIWLVVRAIMLGPLMVGRIIGRTVHAVLAVPRWAGRTAFHGVRRVGQAGWSTVSFVGSILLPAFAGALVGAMLGLIGGMEHNDADVRVPAGAVIGAGIGLVAGVTRPRRSRKVVEDIVDVQPVHVAVHHG